MTTFTIDFALNDLLGLLEGDTVRAIKLLRESVRQRFFDFLYRGFVYRGLHVAPPATVGTTSGTGDVTIIRRFVWNREFIAAALLAAEFEGDRVPEFTSTGIGVVCHCA